jgi:hypothetical protein
MLCFGRINSTYGVHLQNGPHIGQDLQHLGVHLSGVERFYYPPPPNENPGMREGGGGERGSRHMNLGDW